MRIRLYAVLIAVMVVIGVDLASAGEAPVNVSGKWEGTWSHRIGSGQITLQLVQKGTEVTGRQSVAGVTPLFGGSEGAPQIALGTDVQEGSLEDSTQIFHVLASNLPRRVNFTLTVSGETMTGTVCGDTCGVVKLKKAAF
jgi:hypothetical protein